MTEQSKQLAPLQKKQLTIRQWLYSPKLIDQLDMALPVGPLNGRRMARLIYSEVTRNPRLADCTIESICGVAMACAQVGLEPGPTAQAYVIPYGKEATFQLSYRGLLTLAQNSEKIIGVSGAVVYSKDTVFEFDEGSDAFVRYQRTMDAERGEPVCAFASLKTAGGGNIVRVMSVPQIEKHRQRFSKDKRDNSAWSTDWDEMAIKTVLKKAAKWAPVSTETARAMTWDALAEAGKPQKLEDEVVIAEPMVVVHCEMCDERHEYPIPYDGPCDGLGCGVTIIVPDDCDVDPETNEMIPAGV
ncbi:MAG TPA: recombinase RecT [Candidatus Heimdallarchaeota archaeon]|nr:recombinase RecT [Candidatus Heimdallarchaeota archaeon]